MNKMTIAILQTTVQDTVQGNIEAVDSLLYKVKEQGADLAVLPEMFLCPYDTSAFPQYAEPEDGPIHTSLSALAEKNGIYLVAGSVPEKADGRIYNTSYVFNDKGEQIAKHRKMHLFDIDIEGGQTFRESDVLSPGNEVTVFETPFGKMGLCICYDIRFPELYRLMADKGATVILTPASFNPTTGPRHWELLFRARAVDNQVYTVGAASAQDPDADYLSYGHSILCDPWGDVIEQLGTEEGILLQTIDPDKVSAVREQLPLLKHRRKDLYSVEER